MKCPDCDGDTAVIDSRNVSSPSKSISRAQRETADRLVGWFTPDWIVRTRACVLCRKRILSVELFAHDFDAILKEHPHA